MNVISDGSLHQQVIVHAVSIHSGGGKVLLDQLLVENCFGKVTILICDERYALPDGHDKSLSVHRISPTLLSRWKAEILLKTLSQSSQADMVICFSNLPPVFKLRSKVILYLQNALLLPGIPLYTSSLKVAARLIYEKIWLNIFLKNINEVWVQTEWMKKALEKKEVTVLVKPFLPSMPKITNNVEKKYDFVTISGTAAHKRLLELIQAWNLFSTASMPSLLVISDGLNLELEEELKKLKDHVTVKLNVSRDEIFKYYQESRYLVITSKLESFCLPIYEASHFNLKVLAPDEPYAKDSNLIDAYINLDSPQKTKNDIEFFLRNI